MTDDDRMEALRNIVYATRAEDRAQSMSLSVLGYVEHRGRKGFWPTNAGWNFLGERGRAFDLS